MAKAKETIGVYEQLVQDHPETQLEQRSKGAEFASAGLEIIVSCVFGFMPQIVEPDQTKQTHLRMLMAVMGGVGVIYAFAGMDESARLVRVTVGWRLLWSAPFLLLSTIMGGLPIVVVVIRVVFDIVIPLVVTFVIHKDPFMFVFKTFIAGAMPPVTGTNQVRDWYAYATAWMAYFACMFGVLDSLLGIGFFAPKDATPIITLVYAALPLYCFTMMWIGHDHSDKAHYFGISMGLVLEVVAFLWHLADAPGFMVGNLAVWAGLVAGIHAYTLLWQAVVGPKEGEPKATPSTWLIGGGAVLAVISTSWYAFSGLYGHNATRLAPNIHGQDLLVSLLAGVTGIQAMELKKGGELPALVVSWLLPMAGIYFTCETKMLAHLSVGTPFHPSWHAKELGTIWGGWEIVNFTFWIATFLLTAFGTTVVCLFIVRCTKCNEGWTRLTMHGALLVLASGWFMAIFVSGLPPPLATMAPQDPQYPRDVATIPPNLPNASKVDAVNQHIVDLQVGIFFIAAGPLAAKHLPEDTANLAWVAIAFGWMQFLASKVRLAFGVSAGDGVVNP